jgi:hypothetical protein
MLKYSEKLIGQGMADTRAESLARAIDGLHDSVSRMDENNLALLRKLEPGLIEALNRYARTEAMLREF